MGRRRASRAGRPLSSSSSRSGPWPIFRKRHSRRRSAGEPVTGGGYADATDRSSQAAARRPATAAQRVDVDDKVLDRLRGACAEVITEPATLAEASRDWWPLAMTWALEGQVAGLADVVARPHDAGEVAEVLRVANDARIPVTAAAGRSGVCGASVPLHGGIVLDVTALSGIVDVDDTSLVLDVQAGTFGNLLEEELRATYNKTLGHWPQSIDLSTVGGWLACRSAGQFSNRYGKIEDIVVGLDVVLADGRQISTGGVPRQAVGPDLNQVFVGSEGTLGVITRARLKVHDAPQHEDTARAGSRLPGTRARLSPARRSTRRLARRAAPLRRDRGRSQLPDRRCERRARAR